MSAYVSTALKKEGYVERSDWNTPLPAKGQFYSRTSMSEPFEKTIDRTTPILLEPMAPRANSMDIPHRPQALAARRSPRIAVKAKGKIVFIDPAEIIALEAQGNYVSLRHISGSYLIRESISTIAEKLNSFGFVRIHRCVLVNKACIEELRRCAAGVYLLRVRGSREYTITRTYKKNLRFLAELWLGTEI